MKRSIVFVFCGLLGFAACQPQTQENVTKETKPQEIEKSSNDKSTSINEQKHLGEWVSTSKDGSQISLILKADSTAIFIDGNSVLMGAKNEKLNRELKVNYLIDYSKDPIWLDIILSGKSDEKTDAYQLKGIVRFLTDTKIEWRASDDKESRFDTFNSDDKKSTRVLTKVSG